MLKLHVNLKLSYKPNIFVDKNVLTYITRTLSKPKNQLSLLLSNKITFILPYNNKRVK